MGKDMQRARNTKIRYIISHEMDLLNSGKYKREADFVRQISQNREGRSGRK